MIFKIYAIYQYFLKLNNLKHFSGGLISGFSKALQEGGIEIEETIAGKFLVKILNTPRIINKLRLSEVAATIATTKVADKIMDFYKKYGDYIRLPEVKAFFKGVETATKGVKKYEVEVDKFSKTGKLSERLFYILISEESIILDSLIEGIPKDKRFGIFVEVVKQAIKKNVEIRNTLISAYLITALTSGIKRNRTINFLRENLDLLPKIFKIIKVSPGLFVDKLLEINIPRELAIKVAYKLGVERAIIPMIGKEKHLKYLKKTTPKTVRGLKKFRKKIGGVVESVVRHLSYELKR